MLVIYMVDLMVVRASHQIFREALQRFFSQPNQNVTKYTRLQKPRRSKMQLIREFSALLCEFDA